MKIPSKFRYKSITLHLPWEDVFSDIFIDRFPENI